LWLVRRCCRIDSLSLHDALPISGPKSKTITRDEGIRADTTLETLAKLKPSFKDDGTVTAGNASMLSDGAAALIVASEKAVTSLGDRKSTRLNSSHLVTSYAVFCL